MTTMYELAQQDYRQPKDVPELRRYLQAALEVEHLTIPVYLTGMYSIKPGTNAYAYGVIRSVLLEEMLHMTLAANLLTAVGGKADVSKFVRKYPARLPFADKRVPEVRLRHYSPEALVTFLDIERPQSFVPPNGQKPTGWTSIGQFYDAIRRGVTDLEQAAREQEPPSTIFTGVAGDQIGPRDFYNSGGEVFAVTGLKTALLAIEVISDQGEGAHDTIWDSDDKIFGEERQVAHYFRFNEIHKGRRYGRHDLPRTSPSGPLLDITWADAYPIDPMAKIEDYRDSPELKTQAVLFNKTYAKLIAVLEKTFHGRSDLMHHVVPLMVELRDASQRLYRNPHPNAAKAALGLHASPTFELTDLFLAEGRTYADELVARTEEPSQLRGGGVLPSWTRPH
ncbi:ferritin-like protein [Streptomyces lincolnensis]|uniref:ferritin-like domain-containing protein n=1 Tax=Streptomyces lincolnensis TaxID=1915 RepID=UPI001E2DF572|nr:ferritin-like protein [Streptomyces lincolnensis]MCD7443065.1 ferritin-like protein [Streptomyces lincolnensis]